jgi:hypothetical protein
VLYKKKYLTYLLGDTNFLLLDIFRDKW